MGTCLSKKKNSCSSSSVVGPKSVSTPPSQLKNSGNGVTVSQPEVNLKKEKKLVQEKQDQLIAQEDEAQVKKEIFIIKHRKSHDDNRERNSRIPPLTSQQNVSPQQTDGSASASTNEADESMGNNKIAPSTPNMGVVGLRTSSCTKEEVDAILIQCGRLSRSSSGRAASSSATSGGRKYSGSKRSFDFDYCDNDTISADDDQKRANAAATDNNNNNNNSDLLCEEYDGVAAEKRHHQHRQRHRQSPKRSSSQGRRRTPSRERDQQQQRSSSRERRVSRSPGRRSSETNASSNNNNNTSSRPGKLVSVPATVSSLVMDKSNNGVGFGESAASSGIKRITVKRNVGDGGVIGSRSSASPRSRSPARANGNAANAKVLGENQQQQPSLGRNNSSRKAEQSPYRRNPLSEIDPNSLAYPQSNTNNTSNKLQNRPKKENEAEANQKPNADMNENSKIRSGSRVALEKGVSVNCKAKEQQEEEIKVLSSVTDNVVVKTMVPSGFDNLKQQPQTLTRSRSSRRSRDLDLNPEALLNPTQSYTSLLLEDIHNFHQKSTQQPSISLPACLTKACSILEAVADLNSTTTSSNFPDDRRSPPTYETVKRVLDTKEHPFVESEVVVSDDVMEPSLHKYVTVKRGGSLGGVDMEDQESSGSNSFTVVSNGQQQHWGNICSSSWEPNSADSTDCWTSRLNNSREELEGSSDMKTLNSKKRECDHQHSSGIGRGRIGSSNKGLHTLPVVTAAAST